MLLAASTQRTVGVAILAVVFFGGLVHLFFNIRSAKPEVGSEIELAANRSPELRDEELEGRRLDLALLSNLVMLTIIAIALPVYWLGEPGREGGRNVDTARIFTNRGEDIYIEGAECVNCHGAAGVGGSVTTSLTNDDGDFVAQVVWKAPALNTVLSRFSEDEVLHTLNFGRNGVMPAWGAGGGGPLTDQQLEEVMFYLRSIQIDEERIAAEIEAGVVRRAEEWVLEGTDYVGNHVFEADYLTAIRDAEARRLEATLAVEGPDIQCDEQDLEVDEVELCAALEAANKTLREATDAGSEDLSADAAAWLADAGTVAATAEMMALDADPSLGDESNVDARTGGNLPLRWATLELLAAEDSPVPNIDMYRKYGELLFTNPAAQGTYSCARCHTYGFSFDGAERFSIRDNGTTKSILPDGYVQGGGYFGERLTSESTRNQFDTARTHAQFIETGQTIGQAFGRGGSGGNGQMPGWAARTEPDAVGPRHRERRRA